MRVPPVTALSRAAFAGFAVLLFVGTHWPKLTIPAPGRPDLFVHAAVFAVWTGLLIGAGFFGHPLSRRNLLFVLAIAPVYAAIDESLQAIPWIRRHAAWDDYRMNLAGVAIALAAASILAAVRGKRGARRATMIAPDAPTARRNSAAS